MIATGVGYGVSGAFGYDLPTEIIDLTKPRLECKLDNDDGTLNKISKREYSVGGLISNNPIICGGYKSGSNYPRSCYNVKTKSMTFPMLEKRMSAGSIVLNSTTLWVVGGTPYVHPVSSTEFCNYQRAFCSRSKNASEDKITLHGLLQPVYDFSDWRKSRSLF